MKTYSALKAEIAKLEKQAEAVWQTEVAGVVAKIKEAISAYGLTAADLGFGRGAGRPAKAARAKGRGKSATTVGVAKYRDPKSGKTWTGRGKPPAWIAGAKSRDRFLIEGPAQSAEAASKPSARKAKRAAPAAKRGARARRKAAAVVVKATAVQTESGAASE